MEKTEQFISLLDEYLSGKASNKVVENIKEALKQDPFLKDVLIQQVQARANIRIEGENELREKFNLSFEPLVEQVKPKSNLWKWIFAILGLFCLLALGYLYYNQSLETERQLDPIANETKENEFLLASIEDPSYDLLRSGDQDAAMIEWQKAVQSFISKDYNTTLSLLFISESDQNFLDKNIGKLQLMKGVAYLKLERFDEAYETLSTIESNNPYYDQAEWYSAVCAFYNDKPAIATSLLTKIRDNKKHYKNASAQLYLEPLKK